MIEKIENNMTKQHKGKQTKQDRIIELLEEILRRLPVYENFYSSYSQPYAPSNTGTYLQQRCAKCGQYYTGFHQCITYYG